MTRKAWFDKYQNKRFTVVITDDDGKEVFSARTTLNGNIAGKNFNFNASDKVKGLLLDNTHGIQIGVNMTVNKSSEWAAE